jgi:hypothetical protein
VPVVVAVTPIMVVAISGALRDTQHTLHSSNDATCYSTRCSTDDCADGAGRVVSYRSTLSCAPPDALGLSGNRHHENGRNGGILQNWHYHDYSPLEIATTILAIVGKVPATAAAAGLVATGERG